MPHFLDFVFPFGRQIRARDTHFSGFRAYISLNPQLVSSIPLEAGRSGLGFRLCYNLKSVEPYPGRTDHPWSIRATAIYHDFDAISGASTLITIKGSELIKNRVVSAVKEATVSNLNPRAAGFLLTTIVHSLLCQWANEHWRWYINFLDEHFHDLTVPILGARIDEFNSNDPEIKIFTNQSRAATMLMASKPARQSTIPDVNSSVGRKGTQPRDQEKAPQDLATVLRPDDAKPVFEFQNIQKMADIEAKASEAKRVLDCNKDTINSLREHYQRLWADVHLPPDIKAECAGSFDSFLTQTESILADMCRHVLNLEHILHVIDVRRNVVSRITFAFASHPLTTRS